MHQHWVTDQTSSDASLPFSFSGTSVSMEVLFLLLPEGDFWLGTEIFSSPEAAPQQNYALRSPSPASASLKSPAPATQMWSAFRARVHPPIWQLGAQERTRKQRRRSCGAESKWGLLRETGYHVRQAAIGGKVCLGFLLSRLLKELFAVQFSKGRARVLSKARHNLTIVSIFC